MLQNTYLCSACKSKQLVSFHFINPFQVEFTLQQQAKATPF